MQPAPIVPDPTPTSQPFWDGLARGEVMLQHCDDCGEWVYYPRAFCSKCLSANMTWTEISGEGTLYTFTVARQPTTPAFAEVGVQMLAVIELDEGPKVTTTIENAAEEDLVIGARVRPVFAPTSGDVTLLRYELA